jgi:hypothetical protein
MGTLGGLERVVPGLRPLRGRPDAEKRGLDKQPFDNLAPDKILNWTGR